LTLITRRESSELRRIERLGEILSRLGSSTIRIFGD
jgi:hypothetical protein